MSDKNTLLSGNSHSSQRTQTKNKKKVYSLIVINVMETKKVKRRYRE